VNQEQAPPTAVGFPLDQLQVGDLLLMLGKSELSKLIAWFGDSRYSHVSMVSENGMLIEAIRPVAAESPLSKRLAENGPVVLVDAYRSLAADGSPLSGEDRAAVLRHARSLLGTVFAQDELVMVGFLVALRGKPQHLPAWLRWVIHQATEHAIRQDPGKMMCSEFAYRSFADCDVSPPGRLARPIAMGEPSDLPFPEIDYAGLQKEVREILGFKAHDNKAVEAGEQLGEAVDLDVDEQVLDDAIAALRAQLGVDADVADAPNALKAEAWTPPRPNPKLVRPRDLADSIASRFLGKLK
jgi:hypothetical protein